MANYAGCHAIYTSVFVIPRSFVCASPGSGLRIAKFSWGINQNT
jgi:hypothetical protein